MCNPSIQFDIINPISNRKKPHYEYERNLFYFPTENKKYRFYVEARQINKDNGEVNYYFLLGTNKFSEHCRLCEVNMYGMCKIHPRGEIKDYIVRECSERGNINVNFVDGNINYDIWKIE